MTNIEAVTQKIAEAIEGDFPEMLLIAHVTSNPTEIRVEATDNDVVTTEYLLTVTRLPAGTPA